MEHSGSSTRQRAASMAENRVPLVLAATCIIVLGPLIGWLFAAATLSPGTSAAESATWLRMFASGVLGGLVPGGFLVGVAAARSAGFVVAPGGSPTRDHVEQAFVAWLFTGACALVGLLFAVFGEVVNAPSEPFYGVGVTDVFFAIVFCVIVGLVCVLVGQGVATTVRSRGFAIAIAVALGAFVACAVIGAVMGYAAFLVTSGACVLASIVTPFVRMHQAG